MWVCFNFDYQYSLLMNLCLHSTLFAMFSRLSFCFVAGKTVEKTRNFQIGSC